jgi:phosphoribosylformylglycinamidine synthase PurS subunit
VVTRFEALVEVRLRPGIADPQGATIEKALPALGFEGVSDVRAGKAFRLHVDAADPKEAEARVEDLCRRFLTNPVIEDSVVTITAPGAAPAAG